LKCLIPPQAGLKFGVPKVVDNIEFSKNLEKRTRQFSVKIIRLSVLLPNTPEARVIRNQITKSGTSIGTNYREANRARSKADFKNKIKTCESEASETKYWLEVIVEARWLLYGRGSNPNMRNVMNCYLFLRR